MKGTVDAVVVGAGIIGASVAERILERAPEWRVVLLEREEAPGTGETRWATGGVRHQFGTEPNIQLSKISTPVFEQFYEAYGVDPGFRRHGYLFVTADSQRLAIMDREREVQQRLGVKTERLDRDAMKRICPPLFTDDLIGANFCPADGSIEPAALLQAFIDTFRKRGGAIATEATVTAIARAGENWTVTTPRVEYETPILVLACGPQTRAVAALAGLDVPALPYARQVFVAQALTAVPPGIPLTIDIDTGFYVHAHHAELLLGGTDKDSRLIEGTTPDVDWDRFEAVYAAASYRVPPLADAKVVRAYAGARTLTPDHHAILGPVASHPGLFLAAGLSGHGIMHSPAVGILLSEWITAGRPLTWDASPLMLERFAKQKTIDESAVF